MKLDIVDTRNKKVGQADLDSSVFEVEVKANLLHDVVVAQLAARRSGTHSTKGRHEVRGGGAKPWKQKGLGKARAGSIRSPIFRGGGVTFGPKPRDYSYNLTKKVKRAALKSALTLKAQEKALIVVDALPFDEPKTKAGVATLEAFGITGKKTLVVTHGVNLAVEKSFRNIPSVNLLRSEGVNVYDLLNSEAVVMTKDALTAIQERLGTSA